MEFWQYLGNLLSHIFLQSWTIAPQIITNLIAIWAAIIWIIPKTGGFMKNLPGWLQRYLPRIVLVIYLVGVLIYVPYSIDRDNLNQVNQLQEEIAELKAQRTALPDELLASHLVGLRIRITDMTKDYALITGKVFDDCTFFCPCVIQFQEPLQQSTTITIELERSSTIDDVFISTTNERMTGVIAFKNCIFNNCRFVHVGIIAKPDVIEILKSSIKVV
jgi:hypothetical protein